MKIKLNADLNGHKKDETIEIKDDKGVPLDQYWRKRLRDAKIDKCVEIVGNKKAKADKKEVSE